LSTTEGDVNRSPLRETWQCSHLGPKVNDLLERDEASFIHQSLSTPCLSAIVRAEGSWLEDADGRRFLDFHGNSAHQIGYAHPKVVQAVRDQLDRLPFSPRRFTNEPAIALAEKLASLTGGELSRALFVPGGAEAIGVALKLARIKTGRFKTVSMWGSFHGASLEASSVGGEDHFRKDIGPLLPGSEHVPPPDPRRCPFACGECSYACASYLEYVLEKEGDVAAVVAEPIRCTTVVPPPPDFWPRIRRACDRHGAMLIFDEIPTCLGRTGTMFALEQAGVFPDILVVGKGLGGAVFPLAAVLAKEELNVAGDRSIGHYTHEKSPLAAAAALATIDVIESEGLVERSKRLGESLKATLRKATQNNERVLEVRAIGLLIGIEMRYADDAERVLYDCLSKGLSFKVSSQTVLTLAPPLNISDSDLDLAVDILRSALAAL
jgi:4-aminobutyrate aminotransferase